VVARISGMRGSYEASSPRNRRSRSEDRGLALDSSCDSQHPANSLPHWKLYDELGAAFTSIALGLAGVACLVGVELFLRFFDQFLSRY
jgi:hypothetical protein